MRDEKWLIKLTEVVLENHRTEIKAECVRTRRANTMFDFSFAFQELKRSKSDQTEQSEGSQKEPDCTYRRWRADCVNVMIWRRLADYCPYEALRK
jgi:hypothetical protein